MSAYGWAWVIIAAAVPVTLYALLRATRGWPWPGLRHALAWLVGVWLLLPAPVPGHGGHYAPAFLVFAFESLLQRPGSPRASGVILAAGTVLALAVLLLVFRRRASRGDDGQES